MESRLSKEIVFIYFSGNASALQKKLIEQWLASPGSAELYFEWLQEWEAGRPQFLPDAAAAFEKFSSRINGNQTVETDTRDSEEIYDNSSRTSFQWWKWAAVFILSLGFAGYYLRENITIKTFHTARNETRNITLEDGSRVVLNPDSRLKIPRWGFGSDTRDVVLEGEAGFSIRHTKDDKPFVVHTIDENRVVVLGTEFVVFTRNERTSVVLNKGKVRLESKKGFKPQPMRPGDKATISRSGDIEIKKLTHEELATPASWKQHAFNFQQTRLGSAAKEMNEIFGVDIIIEDRNLSERELTGTFKAESADELLAVLAEMLDIKIVQHDGKLYLSSKPVKF